MTCEQFSLQSRPAESDACSGTFCAQHFINAGRAPFETFVYDTTIGRCGLVNERRGWNDSRG
jgi:hypothetical protein